MLRVALCSFWALDRRSADSNIINRVIAFMRLPRRHNILQILHLQSYKVVHLIGSPWSALYSYTSNPLPLQSAQKNTSRRTAHYICEKIKII